LLQEGEALLSSGKEDIKGHLRLSMPSDTGRNVLLGWLDDFQEQHPEVSFTLQFSDRMADLYRDAVDVAIRSGKLVDSSLVSQQLASSRRVLVAAPDYLKKYGTPQTPDDLVHHNCLLFYLRHGLFNHWHFGSGKQVWDIKVSGNRMSDDATIARVWAVAGVGIAYKSWIDVRDDVQSGRLVTLLDEFTCEEVPAACGLSALATAPRPPCAPCLAFSARRFRGAGRRRTTPDLLTPRTALVYFTIRLFLTSLTPLTARVTSAALADAAPDFTKPLNCTVPLKVSTPISVVLSNGSLKIAALTLVVMTVSSRYSPVLARLAVGAQALSARKLRANKTAVNILETDTRHSFQIG